jgi:hypothetical protein
MRTGDSKETKAVVTPEGWVVTDLKYFRFVVDRPIPRSFAWLFQLKYEARDWRVVAFWAVGIGFIVLGVAFDQWLLIPLGVGVLYVWFGLFYAAASSVRDGVLLTGVVEVLQRHSLYPDVSKAEAKLSDGRLIHVVLPTRPASELIEHHGRANVMFISSPKGGYSAVIGVRAPSLLSADYFYCIPRLDRP